MSRPTAADLRRATAAAAAAAAASTFVHGELREADGAEIVGNRPTYGVVVAVAMYVPQVFAFQHRLPHLRPYLRDTPHTAPAPTPAVSSSHADFDPGENFAPLWCHAHTPTTAADKTFCVLSRTCTHTHTDCLREALLVGLREGRVLSCVRLCPTPATSRRRPWLFPETPEPTFVAVA
jgi:hypothetical protein